MIATPEKSVPGDAFGAAEDVLELSPDEFENNLEGNVRQLLLNAVSEVVAAAISSLTDNPDERNSAMVRSAVITEFAPVADILVETLVSKDFKRWAEAFQITGSLSTK